jgi:hypothetical protein
MKCEKLYNYYMFGFNYNILLRTFSQSNQQLLKRLEEYYTFVKELDLSVTLSGIGLNDLDVEREQLAKTCRKKENRTKPVDGKLLKSLHDKLNKIDSILDAELGTKVGYIPSEKRYPLKYLTEDISQLFARGVYAVLPKVARFDFSEFGMCLAMDRYTACAFHVLRGTEDVLKLYYSRLLAKTPTAAATWGTFLKGINDAVGAKKIQPEPPEELMLNLESLRKYYRNRTQHPGLIYSGDEVQDLLGICIKTVNEVIKDMQKRKLLS